MCLTIIISASSVGSFLLFPAPGKNIASVFEGSFFFLSLQCTVSPKRLKWEVMILDPFSMSSLDKNRKAVSSTKKDLLKVKEKPPLFLVFGAFERLGL